MKPFLIAALFAAFEVILLRYLLKAINHRKALFTVLIFLVIFASYGIAIWYLMNRYISLALYCIYGFICGIPVAAMLLFIFLYFLKDKIKFKVKMFKFEKTE